VLDDRAVGTAPVRQPDLFGPAGRRRVDAARCTNAGDLVLVLLHKADRLLMSHQPCGGVSRTDWREP
jgi:hypothetical protein